MATVLTDSKGRKLTLRTLSVLDQARIMRAIGAEQAKNEPYVAVVMAACSIEQIDDVPVPLPRNERDIDDRIGRVGDDGFAMIQAHFTAEAARVRAAAEALLAGGEAAPDPLAD